MKFAVDLPNPETPGRFHEPEHFDTREEARTYLAQWGLQDVDALITELPDDAEDDEPGDFEEGTGFVVGGAYVCFNCLTDAEDANNQTPLMPGEEYECSRCEQTFIEPMGE